MKIASLINGKKVATISPSASLYDLVMALAHHHVGALVVSPDGQRLDGIVSERDVVRSLSSRFADFAALHVRDLMSVDLVTCTEQATVAEVMTLMTEHRIRHVPVVDGAGLLNSIVSIGDLVKAQIDELGAERDALRSYINQ